MGMQKFRKLNVPVKRGLYYDTTCTLGFQFHGDVLNLVSRGFMFNLILFTLFRDGGHCNCNLYTLNH